MENLKDFLQSAMQFHELLKDNNIKAPETDKLKTVITTCDNLAVAMLNDGIDPVSLKQYKIEDIDKEIGLLAKDAGIGSTSVLTQQIIVKALQMMPETPTIFNRFSVEMKHKTGTQIMIPYIGSAFAARDIGPGQELPTLSIDRDAEVYTKTGRAGVKVELDEETMRTSVYNILKLHITLAERSLAQWKDWKAVNTVLSAGTVVYDNFDPSNSKKGYTSGRSLKDGKLNGAFTLRDLHSMYAEGAKNGYALDTILMSQWGYLMFMYDPTLRQFIEANGGVYFPIPKGYTGNASRMETQKVSRGAGPGGAFGALNANVPSELRQTNFQIIVTNYMPTYSKGDLIMKKREHGLGTANQPYAWATKNYDVANAGTGTMAVKNFLASVGGLLKYPEVGDVLDSQDVYCGDKAVTDLVFLDSTNSLLYLFEEGIKVAEKTDNMLEMKTIAFRERYSFAILEKGRAIFIAKNLVVNEDVFDFTYNVKSTVTEAQDNLSKEV